MSLLSVLANYMPLKNSREFSKIRAILNNGYNFFVHLLDTGVLKMHKELFGYAEAIDFLCFIFAIPQCRAVPCESMRFVWT